MALLYESLIENFTICKDNLSLYYIGSALITFLSVVIAYGYHDWCVKKTLINRNEDKQASPHATETINKIDENEVIENESVITVKQRQQYAKLTEQISRTLTEDQLEEEKQVEKEQLEAIFKLLQNQEEKFQIGSLQEIEDQMKLYRY